MHAAYDVTHDDIAAWMRFALDEAGQLRQARRTINLLLPLAGGLLGWLLYGRAGAASGVVVAIIIAFVVMPAVIRRTVEQRIRHELDQVPLGLVGRHSLELDPDTIRWQTAYIDARWLRPAVRDVRLTDDHGFVRFGPSNAIVVPLHDDHGERRLILEALAAGLPPNLPGSA